MNVATVVVEYDTPDGEARRLAFAVTDHTVAKQVATIAGLLPERARMLGRWRVTPDSENTREA